MGICRCKAHGLTGMVFICSHLSQNIRNKVRPEKIIKLVFPDPDGTEYKSDFVLHYCPACIAAYNFPAEDSEMPDEHFDAMYKQGFSPNCSKCFDELTEQFTAPK